MRYVFFPVISLFIVCFGYISPAQNSSSGEIIGIPWVGEKGITESVAEIMARNAVFLDSVPKGVKPTRILPDRTDIPQDPFSENVAQWPPLKGDQPYSPPIESPQTLGLNFTAATLAGTNPTFSYPPDNMGDVGPTQYIVAVNGRIVSFNKTTGVADGALNAGMNTFFSSVRNSSGVSDPRIRYDRHSGRWFVIIINVASTNNRILLAVSNSSTITSLSNFTFFFFQHNLPTPAGNDGEFADYPTLGVDPHALYIGLNMFAGFFSNVTAFVVQKSSLISGGPIVVTAFRDLLAGGAGPYTPQGVDNLDPTATDGYFIGVNFSTFGTLVLRKVSNPGASPTLSSNIFITVPTTSKPQTARHLGNTGGTNGRISTVDDRLFQAVIRNGRLWAAHNIFVSNTGVASGTTTRNGSRWYEIQDLGGTPSLVQSGTVFDPAAPNDVNQVNYYFPAVMVSGQGHVAMGFSASGENERVNAGTVGRLVGDPLGTMQSPLLYTASSTAYNPSDDPGSPTRGRRWGDYSYTSVDPEDDMTMWTVQQFCNATNSYGVRVVQLMAPPPATPASSSPPSVVVGQASVNVTITGSVVSGSGFFDPGPGFSKSIAASVTGGVVVNSVTYVNPTTVILNLNTTGATTGAKNVSVTNPDGQVRTGNGILTITTGPSITVSVPNGGESWSIGTNQNITWSSSGVVGNVKVDLSRNGGATFPEVLFASTANDGSESWTVTGPAAGTARVRISSISDPSVADTSNANFTIITGPSITVSVPNGGESWSIGTNQNITWSSSGVVGNVKIDLSRNGGATFPEVVFASTANDGSESWTVTGPATGTARVRISSISDPSVADTSNANFTITSLAPTLFLSVSPDTMASKDPSKGKFWKPVKRGEGLKPNWANLLDETVAQGGFQPGASEGDAAGGLVAGISHMENIGGKWKPVKSFASTRGWVRLTKWNFAKNLGKGFIVLQKTLDDKGVKHTGTPRGFNTFANTKPFVKQQTKLLPKKQNNILFAELVALKFNIAASQLGKTPSGFGELIFDQDASPYDEMSVLEISARADSMLTFWNSITQIQYDSVYSAIRRINRAFLGTMDTLTFEQGPTPKLTLAGSVDVNTVSFLKLPSPFIPTVVAPTTDETESGEDFYDIDDEEEMDGAPTVARLFQNFPNPFNPSTTIAFRLTQDATVTLRVYNVLGQEIGALLYNEDMDEGVHTVEFSALELPSGVYFYRINAAGLEDDMHGVAARKMLLVK